MPVVFRSRSMSSCITALLLQSSVAGRKDERGSGPTRPLRRRTPLSRSSTLTCSAGPAVCAVQGPCCVYTQAPRQHALTRAPSSSRTQRRLGQPHLTIFNEIAPHPARAHFTVTFCEHQSKALPPSSREGRCHSPPCPRAGPLGQARFPEQHGGPGWPYHRVEGASCEPARNYAGDQVVRRRVVTVRTGQAKG